MKPMPLRYKISSWRQLPSCLSNNSRSLHLQITDFLGNDSIRGFRISVVHDIYGVLFACLLNARGVCITLHAGETSFDPSVAYEMTTDQILKELEKYGFLIEFNPRASLPGNQIDYLLTLGKLKFDKLRIMPVWKMKHSTKQVTTKLVAFQAEHHPQWLNNDYSCSIQEFTKALDQGTAINLTDISNTLKFQWDWLDYVANIDDIIADNAGDRLYGC